MKKILISISAFFIVFTSLYLLGPKANYKKVNPSISLLNIPIDSIDQYLINKENDFPNIKIHNESRIVWADLIKKTKYSIVYLHGFSAGVMESNPVHVNLAKKYGCNLYLPRLSGHGLADKESFKNLTPNDLVEDAKEAIAIGNIIGEKVIVLSCSTGGTLSIYLTAHNPELIHSQILYSPNISLYDPLAKTITEPWGREILKYNLGDYKKGRAKDYGTRIEDYWTLDYRIEGLIALQSLIDQTMIESTFSMISSPYFMGYYYKNEKESDHVVSVDAMQAFDQNTSTPDNLKVNKAFPNVGVHVIASDLKSKDIEGVINSTSAFIEEVLQLESTE
ncbi:MAG: alpha/beta hydrolase [Reichenbachiella sp.]